jgi:phosphoribosylformylglycinamidine synthase
MHAVAEAARNLTCSGARPLAVTDCLNFGNPEKPGVFYQFVESVTGIAEACRALDTPVVSGNVSFYNETNGEDIYPTPIIGMVGVVEDLDHLTTIALKESGNTLVLLGALAETLGGSEFAAMRAGRALGPTPQLDLDVVGDLGADLVWEIVGRADVALFGEGGSRIIVETREADLSEIKRSAREHEVPFVALGRVSDEKTLAIRLDGRSETYELRESIAALRQRWEEAIPWAMR